MEDAVSSVSDLDFNGVSVSRWLSKFASPVVSVNNRVFRNFGEISSDKLRTPLMDIGNRYRMEGRSPKKKSSFRYLFTPKVDKENIGRSRINFNSFENKTDYSIYVSSSSKKEVVETPATFPREDKMRTIFQDLTGISYLYSSTPDLIDREVVMEQAAIESKVKYIFSPEHTYCRPRLIEWMFDLVYYFDLNLDVAFSSCSLFDLFIFHNRNTENCLLQLVALTCVFINSKFSDVHPIGLKDCIHSSCDEYTADDVRLMERKIIHDFTQGIIQPTIFTILSLFCRRFLSTVVELSAVPIMLILSEVVLMMEEILAKYDVNVISSAIFLVILSTCDESLISEFLNYIDGHSINLDLCVSCRDDLMDNIQTFDTSQLESTQKRLDFCN